MRRGVALSLGIKVYLKPDAVPLINVANVSEEQESMPLQASEKRNVRAKNTIHCFMTLTVRAAPQRLRKILIGSVRPAPQQPRKFPIG